MKKLAAMVLKILLFLALLAGLWHLTQPLSGLNRVSFYNTIFPGRERLPFGESPQTAYNFSIDNLDAAFASHKISSAGEKTPGTLRAVEIGDSSSWGTLLKPEETMCGQLNGKALTDGRIVECYNLAYPTLSLAKDNLLLNRALTYEPDIVIWPLTLESFPKDKQHDNALVQANWNEFAALFPEEEQENQNNSFWSQRRQTADWLRLQLYGLLWAGTGIDQDYPESYAAPQLDLTADSSYHGYDGALPDDALSWDYLETGIENAGEIPVILINEPILISNGINSEIRYNYYYPRAAYDSWRASLIERAAENGWNLLDLWDSLEIEAFTNSAIHYNAESAAWIAEQTLKKIEVLSSNGQL